MAAFVTGTRSRPGPRGVREGQHRLAPGRWRDHRLWPHLGRILRQALAVTPAFKQFSGIDVQFQKIHPRELRQKAILDLSTKTGTWATSATDPMYYPLYVANGWIDPLDDFLDDPYLTDKAWFDYEDILRELARGRLDRRRALRHPLRRRGDDPDLPERRLRQARPQARRDPRRVRRQRRQMNDPRTGCGARRSAASRAPGRTCTSTRRSSSPTAASGSTATS